jgi:hypothetical protein
VGAFQRIAAAGAAAMEAAGVSYEAKRHERESSDAAEMRDRLAGYDPLLLGTRCR